MVLWIVGLMAEEWKGTEGRIAAQLKRGITNTAARTPSEMRRSSFDIGDELVRVAMDELVEML